MCLNHIKSIPTFCLWKKFYSIKQVSGAKKNWNCWLKYNQNNTPMHGGQNNLFLSIWLKMSTRRSSGRMPLLEKPRGRMSYPFHRSKLFSIWGVWQGCLSVFLCRYACVCLCIYRCLQYLICYGPTLFPHGTHISSVITWFFCMIRNTGQSQRGECFEMREVLRGLQKDRDCKVAWQGACRAAWAAWPLSLKDVPRRGKGKVWGMDFFWWNQI